MPHRVENNVRKGEIACFKQFLLFSQCFPQLYISLEHQNAALCGNELTHTKSTVCLSNKNFVIIYYRIQNLDFSF